MMYFEHKDFGRGEILCLFKDIAIIELENNIEKYVITVGFDFENKCWHRGYYCKNFKLAGEIFNNLLEDFYMVSFKI